MTSRKKKHEEAVKRREEWLAREAERNRRNLEKSHERERRRKEAIAQAKAEKKRKAAIKAAMKKLHPKENADEHSGT